jgi:hypothetical protein
VIIFLIEVSGGYILVHYHTSSDVLGKIRQMNKRINGHCIN